MWEESKTGMTENTNYKLTPNSDSFCISSNRQGPEFHGPVPTMVIPTDYTVA